MEGRGMANPSAPAAFFSSWRFVLYLIGGCISIAGSWYIWKRMRAGTIALLRVATKHNQRKLRDTTTLQDSWNSKIDTEYKDKCVGAIVALTCGDILGSNLECENPRVIQQYGTIHSFPRNRKRYTDDTEMTLALMESLIKNNSLNAAHCSENYGVHYLTRPSRGYGKSAQKTLKALGKKKISHLQSGYLVNEDGSWANGGAMRVAPIGLCFRNAPDDVLFTATYAAVMCTHRHPVGIDGAFAQAILVRYCAKHTAETFSWDEIINEMIECAHTDEVKQKLQHTKESLARGLSNLEFAESFDLKRNRYGAMFQIRASDCVASVAFIVGKFYREPEICVQEAVSLGGDTDTIACMVGACMGALHGTSWIPLRWFKNIENSATHGRDVLINSALQISQFDFRTSDFVDVGETKE